MQAARAVADGRCRRAGQRRLDRRGARRRAVRDQARAGHLPAGARDRRSRFPEPRSRCSTSAPTSRSAPSTSSSSRFMGAALAGDGARDRARRASALLSNGEEPGRGTPVVVEAHRVLAARAAGSPALDFVGNVEGTDIDERRGGRDRHRRLHRQRRAQGDGGRPRRRCWAPFASVRPRPRGRRPAALLLRPALRALPRRDRPRGSRWRRICSACGASASCRTGASSRYGFSQAILLAARGVREDVVGRTHAALDAAGALRAPPPASASGAASSVPPA